MLVNPDVPCVWDCSTVLSLSHCRLRGLSAVVGWPVLFVWEICWIHMGTLLVVHVVTFWCEVRAKRLLPPLSPPPTQHTQSHSYTDTHTVTFSVLFLFCQDLIILSTSLEPWPDENYIIETCQCCVCRTGDNLKILCVLYLVVKVWVCVSKSCLFVSFQPNDQVFKEAC